MTNIRKENPITINQPFHKRKKWKSKRRRRRRRRVKKKVGKKSQPCRFPNNPEEIIVEILSRLSLSSLSRFACVSKQWRSLVSDIIPTKTGRKMVLVHSVFGSSTPTFHPINEESHVKQVWSPWVKSTFSHHPIFFGSCNGLVLLNIKDDLFLWNPVTRYFKKVISYNLLADDDYRVASGLFYDSLSNEYKTLVALSHERPLYGGEFVMVGSFTSKDWRMVSFPYEIGRVKSGPVVNGNLHWYGPKYFHRSPYRIVYFNPHMNKFHKVPMPEQKAEEDVIFGLGVSDGYLSMVRRVNRSNFECHIVEVLAMKEYGTKKSWTLLCVISNLAISDCHILKPLCYTKDGEALMKVSTYGNGRGIRAYNLDDNLFREISIQPNHYYVDAIMYEESLVIPTGYDWEEEELRGEVTNKVFYYGSPNEYQKRRNGSWESFCIEEKDHEQQNSEDDSQSETDEE